MPLPVLSLSVLAARVVVERRLDFSTFLAGRARGELEALGRLEGTYREGTMDVTARRFDGTLLPEVEWSKMQQSFLFQRKSIRMLQARGDITVTPMETTTSTPTSSSSTSPSYPPEDRGGGGRGWVVELAGFGKLRFNLRSRAIVGSSCAGYIQHYVEGGGLKLRRQLEKRKGKRSSRWIETTESFSLDSRDNLVWHYRLTLFQERLVVTKTLRTTRSK